jgi:membrane-anchored glycerophosphoryl diester phosphodiesterase (GDPDase)
MLVAPMGAAGAFARSWRLTSGNFWRLVLIFSVGGVILLVLYLLTSGVAGVILGIFGRGDVAVITATLAVVIVAVGALAIPFYTALGLAVFGDLTARKEGTDLAQRIAAT